MSTPKISVLISVYNAANTIRRCIESILDQTFSAFEIVLVNDGSDDATLSIIKSIEDPRLILIDLPHIGLPRALNEGLKHCKGKYIARMDADDWSFPYRLQVQFDALEKHEDMGVVTGLVAYAGDRSKNEGYARHVDWVNSLKDHQAMYDNRFEDSPIVNPSCMFRRELIEKFGGYIEADIPEDYEFWLRMFQHKVKFCKVEKPMIKWYDLDDRLTRTSDHYSMEAFQKVKVQYLIQHLKKASPKHRFYVFGTGKSVMKKSEALRQAGIQVEKYIEVKDGPYQSSDIIHYSKVPEYSANMIILSYIGDRAGKEKVKTYLEGLNYKLGESYFIMC